MKKKVYLVKCLNREIQNSHVLLTYCEGETFTVTYIKPANPANKVTGYAAEA